MLQVEYFLPPHAANVSPEAMDLLQQILVEDPVKRRGLKEIQSHPWYAPRLPQKAGLRSASPAQPGQPFAWANPKPAPDLLRHCDDALSVP